MNILIVDDSKAMRMIVSRAIRQAGFDTEITQASDAAQAFELLQATVPDLVLCDWNMPGMSGLDLLNKLHDNGVQVKFGFVTSESTPAMRVKAKEAGALFLISKPFTTETLEDQLRLVL